MAKFNEILVGRFNRYIQKLTQVKGEPPSAQIAGEIVPSIDLNNVWPEDRYLLSYDTFAQGAKLGPTAAVVQEMQMRNPANSNVIARIVKAVVASSAADTLITSYQASGITTDLPVGVLGAVGNFDARSGRSNTIVVSNGTNATPQNLTSLVDEQQLLASVQYAEIVTPEQDFILLPGATIRWCQTVVNLTFTWSVMWFERFLEESERA